MMEDILLINKIAMLAPASSAYLMHGLVRSFQIVKSDSVKANVAVMSDVARCECARMEGLITYRNSENSAPFLPHNWLDQ